MAIDWVGSPKEVSVVSREEQKEPGPTPGRPCLELPDGPGALAPGPHVWSGALCFLLSIHCKLLVASDPLMSATP